MLTTPPRWRYTPLEQNYTGGEVQVHRDSQGQGRGLYGVLLGLNISEVEVTFTPRDAGLVTSPTTTLQDLTRQTTRS